MFNLPTSRTHGSIRTAVSVSALIGGLAVTVGLAAPSSAAAQDTPPITLPPNFTITPPTTEPAITVSPDITITTTTVPQITVPIDISIPPPSDPTTTLPSSDTTVPGTSVAPTTTPPPPPPPPPPAGVPSAPQSVTAQSGNQLVVVTWSAPATNGGAAIDKYRVERATSAAGPFTNLGPSTSPFINSGLTNGTKYYFRVRAHNSVGWSAPSTVVSATPLTTPSKPVSFVATPVYTGIKLTWQAPVSNGGAPVFKYTVNVYEPDCTTKLKTVEVFVTNYTFVAVNGTKRCFRVWAVNSVGAGASSNTAIAITGRPSTPVFCSLTAGSSGSVSVTWLQPETWGGSAPVGYEIAFRNGGSVDYTTVTPGVTGFSWSLPPGTWHAEIYAVNTQGKGLPCTTSTVTVS